MKAVAIVLFFLMWVNIVFAEGVERFLVVLEPVADIRKVPKDALPGYAHDDLEETQVLYNEALVYKGENVDWYKIEVLEQKEFSHNKFWQGYPGWIKKEKVADVDACQEYDIVTSGAVAKVLKSTSFFSATLLTVSIGTKFKEIETRGNFYKIQLADKSFGWINKSKVFRIGQTLNPFRLRKKLIATAKLFLKIPYLWGGRSFAGVDCSGLVNLTYRACGIDVPRDAQEQWMSSKQIAPQELEPADVIFISKAGDFGSITHVMLFIGGESFIEAPGTGKVVCVNTFKKKFGISFNDLKEKNFIAEGKKIYFGRVLS